MLALEQAAVLLAGAPTYKIANALRFDRADASRLFWTPGGAATNSKKVGISIWAKFSLPETTDPMFSSNANKDDNFRLIIASDGSFGTWEALSSTNRPFHVGTNRKLRDSAAWQHILFVLDTAQATASERVRFYINGERDNDLLVISLPPLNYVPTYLLGAGRSQFVGYWLDAANHYHDGPIAEVIVLDDQAPEPEAFGRFDLHGHWVPRRFEGSFGGNSFHLDFADAMSLGADRSGLGHDFTLVNVAADHQSADTPSDNHLTWNALQASATVQRGGLQATQGNSDQGVLGTVALPRSGKWIWEVTATAVGANVVYVGLSSALGNEALGSWNAVEESYFYLSDGTRAAKPPEDVTAFGAAWDDGDVIGICYDADAGEVEFFKNGASQGTVAVTHGEGVELFPKVILRNATLTLNAGQAAFAHTPPTGARALSTANLPPVAVKAPRDWVEPLLYTGDGAIRDIAPSRGFTPGMAILKGRDSPNDEQSWRLGSSIQGPGTGLQLESGSGDLSEFHGFKAWATGKVTIGSDIDFNADTLRFVIWLFRFGLAAGFKLSSYGGDGVAGRSLAHGLGRTPHCFFVKSRSIGGGTPYSWWLYHRGIDAAAPEAKALRMNNAANAGFEPVWNDTPPDASGIVLGAEDGVNASGVIYLAGIFAPIPGFSAFPAYLGNGAADGPFVWLGFRPALLVIKRVDLNASWLWFDEARNPGNPATLYLSPDIGQVEGDLTLAGGVDLLSNGIKIRSADALVNASGGRYIVMAWARQAFGGKNVSPALAR